MRRLFLLLLPALLWLTGCAHKSAAPTPSPAERTLPAWYLEPPQNGGGWLYGVGEGKTMEEATKQALADLLARVSVTVSSRYRSREYTHEDVYEYVETERSHDIETTVAKLPVTHYRTLKSAHPAWDRYLVLAGVRRDDFVRPLEKEIVREYGRAESLWREAKNANALERYDKAAEAEKIVEHLLPKATILASLDRAYEPLYQKSEEAFLKYAKMKERAKKSLRFCIESASDPAMEPFAETVASALSERGFPVLDTSRCPTEAIRISLLPTLSQDRSHGFFIVKGTVDLKMHDENGKVIQSRRYRVKGISAKSPKAAILEAAKGLERALVEKFLF